MNYPILYSFRRCPYAMRARMALYLAGITYEVREIDLKNKPAAMCALSPKGTVPVLQCLTGDVIDESLDIMHWALCQHDPQNILGCFTTNPVSAKALIHENDHCFKKHLDRYKYPNRYENSDRLYHQQQAFNFIARLAECLKNHNYLSGSSISFTDVAIFPFIRQFASVDYESFRAKYPTVEKWLNLHLTSELFQQMMQKYPLYQPEQAPIIVNTLKKA